MIVPPFIRRHGPPSAGVLPALVLAISGFDKIARFDTTAGPMASKGLPFVPVLPALAIMGGMLPIMAYGPGPSSAGNGPREGR